MDEKEDQEERIFKPAEYPINIDIYDAFLKFELEQHFGYGVHPEDWHDFYLIFAAGYLALAKYVKEKINE